MTLRTKTLPILLGVAIATGGALAWAQQPPQVENPATTAPAPAVTPAPAATGQAMLGLTDIEALLKGQGIRVHEIEVRDSVVEAEGRDASNREVEVIVDRRTGEILSRRFDD